MESYKHFGMARAASRPQTAFQMIGTNYKLSNIQAAVGLGQFHHIEKLMEKRQKLASVYNRELSAIKGISIPKTTSGGVHSYQSYCIFVDNRDHIMTLLRDEGIEVQIGTYSLHMQKAFSDNPWCRIMEKMQGSRYAFQHCLTLPMYHDMTPEIQAQVIDRLVSRVLKG